MATTRTRKVLQRQGDFSTIYFLEDGVQIVVGSSMVTTVRGDALSTQFGGRVNAPPEASVVARLEKGRYETLEVFSDGSVEIELARNQGRVIYDPKLRRVTTQGATVSGLGPEGIASIGLRGPRLAFGPAHESKRSRGDSDDKVEEEEQKKKEKPSEADDEKKEASEPPKKKKSPSSRKSGGGGGGGGVIVNRF